LDLTFEDIGEQRLKNIARPVRVFRVLAAQKPAPERALALPDKPSIAVLPFDRDITGSWRDVGRALRFSAGRAAWPGPRTPRQLPAFRYRKEKSRERRTVCWREMDSNFQFRAG